MMHIALARATALSDALANSLHALGWQAHCLPLITVIPHPHTPSIRSTIQALDRFDQIIVSSPVAARCALTLIDEYWPQLPVGITWFCNGPGTAWPLQTYGIQPHYPQKGFTSEEVFELLQPTLNAQHNLLIIGGDGGRPWLMAQLKQQSLSVTKLALYRRELHPLTPALRQQLLSSDLLLITSAEVLAHISEQLTPCQYNGSLLVSSSRLAEYAYTYGWPTIEICAGASDTQVLSYLSQRP